MTAHLLKNPPLAARHPRRALHRALSANCCSPVPPLSAATQLVPLRRSPAARYWPPPPASPRPHHPLAPLGPAARRPPAACLPACHGLLPATRLSPADPAPVACRWSRL
ncbi:hypothetical protein GGX14DRAFT_555349 [Mycena pura]|uniref:Uncharacterized protein n=1 Tax=Mycena pura TaxID=153505 RepID=A0AAD6YQU2_9AGAR|nr:hypothetical protein GGX14DRAFT_555349 [Mycena pura]